MATIRRMTSDDKNTILEMMRVFYASSAILTNGFEAPLYLELIIK